MKRVIFMALAFGSMCWSCSVLQVQNYNQVFQQKGRPPTIIDHYAPEVISPGTAWKIYVRAEDEDGDMQYIATTLYQEGFGYYSTDYTRLAGAEQKQFAGYLLLKTPVDADLTLDAFAMEVVIRDSEQNRSQIVKLPLTFNHGKEQSLPPEWQEFRENQLGVLVTHIQSMKKIMERTGS
jgi:hypothetical protein